MANGGLQMGDIGFETELPKGKEMGDIGFETELPKGKDRTLNCEWRI
jgi:hypothetical protein